MTKSNLSDRYLTDMKVETYKMLLDLRFEGKIDAEYFEKRVKEEDLEFCKTMPLDMLYGLVGKVGVKK